MHTSVLVLHSTMTIFYSVKRYKAQIVSRSQWMYRLNITMVTDVYVLRIFINLVTPIYSGLVVHFGHCLNIYKLYFLNHNTCEPRRASL